MPKSALSDRFPTIDKIVVGEKKKRFESISRNLVQAERAASSTESSHYWKTYGRAFRWRYRLNIYLKDKDVSN